MSVKEGGAFQTFRDPNGNVLITLNRDGTVATTGIDFADGTTQTTAAGGGGGITLQTDGVDNGSQVLLNLQSGTNISVQDDGVGNISINNTATPTAQLVHTAFPGYYADSQILNLHASPQTLATVAAGKRIIPISCTFLYISGGVAAFTNVHTGDLNVYTSAGTQALPFFRGSSTGLLDQGGDSSQVAYTVSFSAAPVSTPVGSGDAILVWNSGTDYTGGDAGQSNEFGVSVSYLILDVITGLLV